MQKKTYDYFFPKGFRNFIVATLKGGLLVALPITIFIVLVGMIISFFIGLLAPFKSLFGLNGVSGQWFIDLLSVLIVIFGFFLIGLFVDTRQGKRFFLRFEQEFFMQLPMYTSIKETVQQFTGTRKMPFRQVVSVDVFNNSTRMIGFITDEMDHGFYAVFVPTGPNPTNGFIFCVNKEQLEFLDVKPDAAMRMIIGVGTGASNLFNVKKDLLDDRQDLPVSG